MKVYRSAFMSLVYVLFGHEICAQQDSLALRVSFATTCDTVLTLARLQQLPIRTVQVIGHDGEQVTYTGALLTDVLGAGCPAVPSSAKRDRLGMVVRVNAWDDYHAVVALMEADTAFREHPILLTWMRDGILLDGHYGPFQLMVPDDLRHARNVRRVKRLSVLSP